MLVLYSKTFITIALSKIFYIVRFGFGLSILAPSFFRVYLRLMRMKRLILRLLLTFVFQLQSLLSFLSLENPAERLSLKCIIINNLNNLI